MWLAMTFRCQLTSSNIWWSWHRFWSCYSCYEDDDNIHSALLFDATNALKFINHKAALHNISVLCPSFLPSWTVHQLDLLLVKVNLHPLKALLMVIHLPWLWMQGLAVTPLTNSLCHYQPDVSQTWFADDATAAGQVIPLLQWWKELLCLSPLNSYHPNAAKTYLIVKPQFYDSQNSYFRTLMFK